jgi:hypothetical protein
MASPRGNPKSGVNLTPVGLANSPLGLSLDPRRTSQTSPRHMGVPVTASPLSRCMFEEYPNLNYEQILIILILTDTSWLRGL